MVFVTCTDQPTSPRKMSDSLSSDDDFFSEEEGDEEEVGAAAVDHYESLVGSCSLMR